jgi:hypothetical protein
VKRFIRLAVIQCTRSTGSIETTCLARRPDLLALTQFQSAGKTKKGSAAVCSATLIHFVKWLPRLSDRSYALEN